MRILAPWLLALALTACGDKADDTASSSEESGGEETSEEEGAEEEGGEEEGGEDGSTEEGKDLYAQHCADCHGIDGRGGSDGSIEGDMDMSDAQLVAVILDGKGQKMPPTDVSEEEAQLIVDHLRVLFAN